MTSDGPQHAIDYGRGRSPFTSASAALLLIVCLLLVIASIILLPKRVSHYVTNQRLRSDFARAKAGCLNFREGAWVPVYDESEPMTRQWSHGPLEPPTHVPLVWQRLASAYSSASDAKAINLDRSPLDLGAPHLNIAFLQERISRSGKQRMLVVNVDPQHLTAGVYDADTFLRVTRDLSHYLIDRANPTDTLRFFAGQGDPQDAASFTIGFEYHGERHQIRGRLEDNDTVNFCGFGWFTEAPANGTWNLSGKGEPPDPQYALHEAVDPDRRLKLSSGAVALKFLDEKTLAYVSREHLRTLRIDSGHDLSEFELPRRYTDRVIFSPDNRALLLGSLRNRHWLWLLTATGETVRPQDDQEFGDCAFSPDSRSVLRLSKDCVQSWDVQTGNRLPDLTEHDREQPSVAGALPLLQFGQATQKHRGRRLAWGSISRCAFSPDGQQVAARMRQSNAPDAVEIYDAKTGLLVHRRQVFGNDFGWSDPVWSTNGRNVALAIDHFAYLWVPQSSSAQYRLHLPGSNSLYSAIAISPDGRWLAGANSDNDELFLWRLDDAGLPRVRAIPAQSP